MKRSINCHYYYCVTQICIDYWQHVLKC
jgi:hypothetical protein